MQIVAETLTSDRIVIVGAGVIGLSIALALRQRGHDVVIVEAAAVGERSLGQASFAAAGMLAAEDRHHPKALQSFAAWSGELYPSFLDALESSSGIRIPFQTTRTMEYASHETRIFEEQSIDPRQLLEALESAIERSGIPVHRGVRFIRGAYDSRRITVGSKSATDYQQEK